MDEDSSHSQERKIIKMETDVPQDLSLSSRYSQSVQHKHQELTAATPGSSDIDYSIVKKEPAEGQANADCSSDVFQDVDKGSRLKDARNPDGMQGTDSEHVEVINDNGQIKMKIKLNLFVDEDSKETRIEATRSSLSKGHIHEADYSSGQLVVKLEPVSDEEDAPATSTMQIEKNDRVPSHASQDTKPEDLDITSDQDKKTVRKIYNCSEKMTADKGVRMNFAMKKTEHFDDVGQIKSQEQLSPCSGELKKPSFVFCQKNFSMGKGVSASHTDYLTARKQSPANEDESESLPVFFSTAAPQESAFVSLSFQGTSFSGVGDGETFVKRNHECDVCEALFESSESLAKHMQTHAGQTSDVYSVFRASLARSENLSRQTVTQTSIKRRHKCEICQKEFTQAGHLKDHMLFHTGERPHVCKVCRKAFTLASHLKRHKQTHICRKATANYVYSKSMSESQAVTTEQFEEIQAQENAIGNVCNEALSDVPDPTQPDLMSACKKELADNMINTLNQASITEQPDLISLSTVNKTALALASQVFSEVRNRRSVLDQTASSGQKDYVCNECKKVFASSDALNSHKRSHASEKPHCSGAFRKTLTEVAALKRSRLALTSDNKKKYACDVCKKTFTLIGTLNRHKKSHSGFSKKRGINPTVKKDHICPVCNKGFARASYLNEHKESVHEGQKKHECIVCKKSFARIGHFNAHMLIHKGQKNFVCDVCGKAFISVSRLKKHVFIHKGQKEFVCDVCKKAFSSSVHLKRHKIIHTGEKPHVCPVCNKAFTYASNLGQHKLIHSGQKNYDCDVCGKSFVRDVYLKKHKLTVHGTRKHHVCGICGKTFVKSYSLKKHALTCVIDADQKEKDHICDLCNKVFLKGYILNAHKVNVHGPKTHLCDKCNKAFARISHLNAHKLIHSGTKNYVCDVCGKAFVEASNLRRHVAVHKDQKDFICNVCSKAYYSASALKQHSLTHTG